MKKRTIIDLILLGLFVIAVGAGIYIRTASKEPRELLVKADHVRVTVLDFETDAEKRVEVDDPIFMRAFLDALPPSRAMERVPLLGPSVMLHFSRANELIGMISMARLSPGKGMIHYNMPQVRIHASVTSREELDRLMAVIETIPADQWIVAPPK